MVRHGIQQGPPIAGPRRIAVITSSYPAGTFDHAGAVFPGFVEALVHEGREVTVLTRSKPGPMEAPRDYEVRWFDWAGASRPLVDLKMRSPADIASILSLLRAGTRALRALIRERRIEHCLAMWAIPSGYYAWRARDTGVPYSVWALGSDIHTWARRPVVGSLVKRVLRGAAFRFADGLALAAEVSRISARDCEFLPTTRALPPPAEPGPVLGPGTKLLFVGRLEPVKGPDVLVEAMTRVLAAGVDASLTICGAGSLETDLRARVSDAKAGGRIRFVSGLSASELSAYMHASDCLVIPSRNESIPVVFSEALQAGIPPIVTDVGDMGALARDHGLRDPVPPDDVKALAAALTDFVRDRGFDSAAYAKARAELLAIFDVKATARRFLAEIDAR